VKYGNSPDDKGCSQEEETCRLAEALRDIHRGCPSSWGCLPTACSQTVSWGVLPSHGYREAKKMSPIR